MKYNPRILINLSGSFIRGLLIELICSCNMVCIKYIGLLNRNQISAWTLF